MRFLCLVFLFACGSESKAPSPADGPVELTEKGRAYLEIADLKDGYDDNQVSKCIACGFGMEGEPAHIIEVEGYGLHMCAAGCKADFEKKLNANLNAMAK